LITDKERKQRTIQQNKALHKYCNDLAVKLNDAGLDMKKVLKPGIDIPWTTQTVKDQLYKPILQALTGKESTIDMDTTDPSIVYEILNRHMSEKFGVSVSWPSREAQMMEEMIDEA
jgi:hypothetical protein